VKRRQTEAASSRLVQRHAASCESCPLRRLPSFRAFAPEELKFVSQLKVGEIIVPLGHVLLSEGQSSDMLYTLLEGWMYRHKSLTDGRRQILNFALPGDFIGLQSAMFKEMQHSVEALTEVRLCVFPRNKLWSLYSQQPGLAFDVTWLAAQEERMLDEHLLSIGRRTAIERMAYLLLLLHRRIAQLDLLMDDGFELPLNQQHVADTLGLSIVHTNKTLRKLHDFGVISWRKRTLRILDQTKLARVARFEDSHTGPRPLI